MPVLSHGRLEIEYSDAGDGPAVVLIHCSVSGIRQWRSLTEVLSDRYRVRALNLYGYGETTPWPEGETQTLEAQARIVVAACDGLGDTVSLVGHSFGGHGRAQGRHAARPARRQHGADRAESRLPARAGRA